MEGKEIMMEGKEIKEIMVDTDSMNMNMMISEESIQELKRYFDLFRKLQQIVLEENIDYGYPAGKKSQDQKPSLYKSGAEKLTRLFGLIAKFEAIDKKVSAEQVHYEFKCTLYKGDRLIGEGYGSCNSFEKDAWKSNPLKFHNNILKIAKKRAHVDAVLTSLGASNVFTQDIEDFEASDFEDTATNDEPMTPKQMELIAMLIDKYSKKHSKTKEEVVENIKTKYGLSDINELTKIQASEVITLLSKK